jgi:short subunit dehydrogenase-like uncharacterized protein
MLAVYGATGYTGQLVARELARREIDAVLCARNGAKLRHLATELGVPFPLRAATIDDSDGLRRALSGVDAVINCAGPFTFYGAPVIEAALDVGAHYVDTTGEQLYMQRVFEHYDAPAEERGVAVVPAVGFDYVPGDLAAAVAARDLDRIEEVVVGYSVRGFGASRGTLRSGVEMAKESLAFEDGRWQRASGIGMGETFDFGPPIGEVPVFRYPGGEIVTVPRHVDTRAVRQRMNARGATPVGALAPLVPAAIGALGLAMRTPAGDLVDALIDRLPEGPPEEAREASSFVIVAEARAFDGRVGRARVEGSDVYGITAVMAVEAARLAAEGGATGALAPAELLEPEGFLDWLAPHGVRWSAEAPRAATARA